MIANTHQIEMRTISSLKPYAGNARTHSKKQIKQIATSIQRFGFTNPVLVSNDDEIIAGHGRVMAAKEIGLSTDLTGLFWTKLCEKVSLERSFGDAEEEV